MKTKISGKKAAARKREQTNREKLYGRAESSGDEYSDSGFLSDASMAEDHVLPTVQKRSAEDTVRIIINDEELRSACADTYSQNLGARKRLHRDGAEVFGGKASSRMTDWRNRAGKTKKGHAMNFQRSVSAFFQVSTISRFVCVLPAEYELG